MKTNISLSSGKFTPATSNSKSSITSLKALNSISTRSTNSIHKTSVRKLLEDKTIIQQKKNSVTLNLTYKDIRSNKPEQISQDTQSFVCYRGLVTKQKQCCCFDGKKCQWINKWLSMMSEPRIPKPGQPNQKLLKQIDMDLERTSNNVCSVLEVHFKKMLRKILFAYCLEDPQINYVQGFNYLVASILVHAQCIQDSFNIFSFIMIQKNFRQIYSDNFAVAKEHTKKIIEVLRTKSNCLYTHMLKTGVDLSIFIFGWIVSLFSNLVSQQYMHLVLDSYLIRGWTFVYSLCVTILLYLREQLLILNFPEDIMVSMSIQNLMNRNLPWEQIIFAANYLPISRKQVYHPQQTMVN